MSKTGKSRTIMFFAAVLTAVLLLSGAVFGKEGITENTETEEKMFTENDRNGFWDSGGATQIELQGNRASVSGSGAYSEGNSIYIEDGGKYVLKGILEEGSVIVDADGEKVWILLDGAEITSRDSAAFFVKKAKKVFLTLAENSVNLLESGSEAADEKTDGAIYSKDDLTINGSGSLTVTSAYKHGIVVNDSLVVAGGNISVTAPKDGIHVNDSIRITNCSISVKAGDDGIHAGNDDKVSELYMESGSVNISECFEGLEADTVMIAGGEITISSSDDGINACGNSENTGITISGGTICLINRTGRDADGLDSNGFIRISGGKLMISVPGQGTNAAIDYGSENGAECVISGGTVIACGSGMMADGFDDGSPQGFIMQNISGEAGSAICLKNEKDEVLILETVPVAFSNIVLSCPQMKKGDKVKLTVEDSETELTVDNKTTGMNGGRFGGKAFLGNNGGRPDFSEDAGKDRGENLPEMKDGKMEPPEGRERGDRPAGRQPAESSEQPKPPGFSGEGDFPKPPDFPEDGKRSEPPELSESGESPESAETSKPEDQTVTETAENRKPQKSETEPVSETDVSESGEQKDLDSKKTNPSWTYIAAAVLVLAGILIICIFRREKDKTGEEK